MNDTMHAASAFWVYYIIYWLIYWNPPPGIALLLVVIFGVLPDFDGILWIFQTKEKEHGMNFQHHLNSWFHWPIRWLWLWIPFLVSLVFNYYWIYFLIPPLGVYMHLIGDSISCGDGMMWKHGWKREQFGAYINLWSSKTDGYHGNYWSARYKTTIFYKIEVVLGILMLITLLGNMILSNKIEFSAVLLCLYISFSIIFTATRDLTKYTGEPEQGRYADYRRDPEYVKWMEENNYELDEKQHPKKKKKMK